LAKAMMDPCASNSSQISSSVYDLVLVKVRQMTETKDRDIDRYFLPLLKATNMHKPWSQTLTDIILNVINKLQYTILFSTSSVHIPHYTVRVGLLLFYCAQYLADWRCERNCAHVCSHFH